LSSKQLKSSNRAKYPSKGIQLNLWCDEHERVHQFEVAGHAGYAEAGQDIVCAAVTALTFSAVNGLEHFLAVAPEIVMAQDGYLKCSLRQVDEQELNQAQWILGTMKLGLEGIQTEYGLEYLKIEIRRWTPC